MPAMTWPNTRTDIHYVKTELTPAAAGAFTIKTRVWWWVGEVKHIHDYETTYDSTLEDMATQLDAAANDIEDDYLADHA